MSLGGEHELAVPVVESLNGSEPGIPDLALGCEANHLVAAEMDEGHDFSPGPRVRDDPRNRNHVVSHIPPQASPTSNGLMVAQRHPWPEFGLAVQVVGRHLQWSTPPVDRRADDCLQEPPQRGGIVGHQPHLAAMRVRARQSGHARPRHGYAGGNGTKGVVLSHEGSTVYASTNHRVPRRGAAVRAGGYNVIVSELCGPSSARPRSEGVQNPS